VRQHLCLDRFFTDLDAGVLALGPADERTLTCEPWPGDQGHGGPSKAENGRKKTQKPQKDGEDVALAAGASARVPW
jgi:hypothetical protein